MDVIEAGVNDGATLLFLRKQLTDEPQFLRNSNHFYCLPSRLPTTHNDETDVVLVTTTDR